MGLKETILGAADLAREKVACPEWGADVHVRTLSGTERDAFEVQAYERLDALEAAGKKDPYVNARNLRARFVAWCLCDADGAPVYGAQPTEADIASLGTKSGRVLDRLYAVAQRLNGLGQKDAEELAGKSEGSRPAPSPSDSA